jgi:hypothetical protein
LNLEQWTQLDQSLQDGVLTALGGLHAACVGSGDLLRTLAQPLIEQASGSLGELLPVTDVAQVEFSAAAAAGSDIRDRVEAYFADAAPLIPGSSEYQSCFLLVPASEAGKEFGEEAKLAKPALNLVRVPGQADLMFCREQGQLTIEELQRVFKQCRAAYEEVAPVPTLSPHSRFDIVDWTPLDP